MSARLSMPAGVYSLAFHQAIEKSSRLPFIRYSLASLKVGRLTILHLLGSNREATFCDAALPGSSASKHKTTLSNVLRYSKLSLQFLYAD